LVDTQYFKVLFDYNAWANERILARAEHVPEADYFAEVPGLSFGSLHRTLHHITTGEANWLKRWQISDGGLLPDEEPADFEAVRARTVAVDAALQAFVAGLVEADLHSPITYLGPNGVEYTDPLSLQLAHVVNHGTQYRAEAAVRLTQLGWTPQNIDLTVLLRGLG
jgi:uncharacterized damage-inducible protein DinB